MSILDLEVLVFPCPKGGPTWREKVKEMGGKAQFPYMVDPNTGTPRPVLGMLIPGLEWSITESAHSSSLA